MNFHTAVRPCFVVIHQPCFSSPLALACSSRVGRVSSCGRTKSASSSPVAGLSLSFSFAVLVLVRSKTILPSVSFDTVLAECPCALNSMFSPPATGARNSVIVGA